MQKTKKTAALAVYEAYWDSYLNGDMKTMASLIDDEFRVIGTTEHEVFFNKKETMQFYKATAGQVTGKAEFRNRNIQETQLSGLVLITEFSDTYILVDGEWVFYSKFRIISLLQNKKGNWKFVLQHGYIPDSKAEEGEQVAFDKISRENLELHDAVKRSTVELESKNHELKIESALEKVRTIAMGIRKPDEMLNVCKTISLQLQSLGVKEIRNVQTAIFYEQRDTYMNYEYYAKHKKTFITETTYTNNEIHHEFAKKMMKGKGEFFVTHIKGEEVKDWIAYQKTTNVFIDKYLEKAPSLNYYWFSLGPVALGISTYHPLTEGETNLFNRFLKVFELAYQRYLDIEKAEAQAQEAKIELALERVRARTMAMQRSDELKDTALSLFQQVKELGIPAWGCGFNIWDEDKKAVTSWNSSEGQIEAPIKIPSDEDIFLRFYQAAQKGESIYIEEMGGKALEAHYRYMATLPGVSDILNQFSEAGIALPTFQIFHIAYFSHGYLMFITYEAVPEARDIFKRYAKVFEQTYTRFLDLQKAEAQAREAQIEAALERVRSRTMGMQKSEELKEVIQVVYEQFVHLNIHIEHTGFIMDYKARDDMHIWLADRHEVPSEVTIPYFDSPHWNSFKEAKEKGMDFFANHLTFEEKNRFYQDLFKLIHGVPEETKEYYFSCPGLAISTVLLENVGLYIENFSGIPYSDEENNTLMRFGKVFQQTYTRFLDLQKAEAQAREAQIEIALERVRSRAIAMQKSDELAETAYVLYEQFGLLGENPEQLTIGIIDETHKIWEFWLTLGGNQINHVFKAPINEPTVLNKSYIAWKERKKSIVIDISGDELKAYYNFFKNLPGYKEFNDFKSGQKPEHRRVINVAFFSNGSLSLSSSEPKPAETTQLLERFAGVLEQTYTRFLDLKNAEAQAREAQIEAALERVRSKTMAMHNSREVGDAVVKLFDEVMKLGLDKSIRCGIGILDKATDYMETWSATSYSNGEIDLKMGLLDMTIHPMLIGLKKAWQNGESAYSYDYIGDDVTIYYDALNKEPEYPFYVDLDTLPENEYHNSFFYSEGILFAFTAHPISEEAAKVLNRFAGVFGQTYRRYLDLQKAEAQSREAQIEAALERVRSKAMAMHNSDDLAITVDTFFSELTGLNVVPHRCGVGIMDEQLQTVDINATTITHTNKIKKVTGKLKLSGHPVLSNIFKHWKVQKEYHPVLRGNEILEYYSVMNPQIAFPDFAGDEIQYGYYFFFKEGGVFAWTDNELTEGDLQIFRRYTSVLSLTYRRYIDLKEAEAQAREAKIEAALERVRSKTLAMHQSDELAETAAIVFKQLIDLGIAPNRLYIGIIKDTTGSVEFWVTEEDGTKISTQFTGDINKNASIEKMYNGWKKQKKSITIDMHGKELSEYFRYLSGELHVPFKQGLSQKRRIQNIAFFSQGFIGIASPDPQPEETIELLKRFAAVFNLTYTRFNDLQQAEAQNKIILAENERKTKELEEARELQLAMLPKLLPKLADCEIAVYMKTATEVGGDYYDFCFSENESLNICLGDATGHGMKAGIMVSAMKSIFTTNAPKMGIEQFFSYANSGIKSMNLKRMMMGFIMLNINKNMIRIINAGMPPIFLYRKNFDAVDEIIVHGMPIGAMNHSQYTVTELSLDKDDVILLLSDGMPELQNIQNEMYGYSRIRNSFNKVAKTEPEEIINYLKNEGTSWAKDKDPDDDITFVVIKGK